ncbi:MAG TPA: toll/interleukin-1 receptor domain-containing protein [Ktedonobacterales bacterium]|nr:toll/interleukin-1 receptor domain-containing protein [Ktedonobacterales bacterium]
MGWKSAGDIVGSGRVFISHTHTDNALCEPLIDRLEAWSIPFWLDRSNGQVGQVLAQQIADQIEAADVFVRLCTPTAASSAWMHRELGMFLAYERADERNRTGRQRTLIPVCFAGYEPDVLERARLYVDATSGPPAAWLDGVRKALGIGWMTFDHDDYGYLWWIDQYPRGYMVNAAMGADRRPRLDSMKLHRTRCGHFVGAVASGGYTGRGFIKICSESTTELDRWAAETVGATAPLVRCTTCVP